MNKLRTLVLTLLPLALFAQPREQVSHTYEFKTLDEHANSAMLTLIQSYFPGRVNVTWIPGIHALVLRGPSADVEAAEALLSKYDVPPREVEFTAWVVRANKAPAFQRTVNTQLAAAQNELAALSLDLSAKRKTYGDNSPNVIHVQTQIEQTTAKIAELQQEQSKGAPVPDAAGPAIEEMKHTFGYQSFELLDTVVTRTKSHAEIENTLSVPNTNFSLTYDGVTISSEGKVVNVPRFAFRLISRGGSMARLMTKSGVTSPSQEPVSSIENEVTLHGDERLVLGKLRLPNSTGDIFVVLTAKPL